MERPSVEESDTPVGAVTTQMVTIGHNPVEHASPVNNHPLRPSLDLSQVADFLPVIAGVVTTRGHAEYLNRCWRTYTGISEPESLYLGWTQALQQGHGERLLNLLDRGGKPNGFEMEVNIRRASDGCYRRHACVCTKLPAEPDRKPNWLLCCIDVEDWRNTEEIARAQAALLGLSVRTHDKEKRKIAHTLHDSAGQYLVALQMKLDGLHRNSAGGARKNPFLDECGELVKRCSREFRAISYLLHPPLLDELGLESAIRFHVESFMIRTKLKVELEVESNLGRFDRELEAALFRVVQEALAVAARHSAQKGQVKIGTSATTVFVEVMAFGGITGLALKFGPSSNASTCLGIALTSERVRSAGGTFEVSSAADDVVIRATVPRKALVAQACD